MLFGAESDDCDDEDESHDIPTLHGNEGWRRPLSTLPSSETREHAAKLSYNGTGNIESDSVRLSNAQDPPGQGSLYIPPGDHAIEIYRLSTFSRYPEHSPVKVTLLAMIGFYFTGFKDRVKCFSCGSVAENFIVGDDPMDPRLHLTDCKMVKGEERMNKPSQFSSLWALFRQFTFDTRESNSRIGTNHSQEAAEVGSLVPTNNFSQNFQELILGNIIDASHERFLRSLNLLKEVERRKTFAKWPSYPCPNLPSELARNGFFYLGNLDRVQCFSCSGVLRNWAPGDIVGEQHLRHFHDCRMASGSDSRNQPMSEAERHLADRAEQDRLQATMHSENIREPPDPSPEEQRYLARNFPCNDAVNPHMASEQRRIETFQQWPREKTRATPEQMASAGMFYLGQSDRTKCYYCNGGLQNWEYNDEPWIEHAKWFPGCEFVLRRKGIEFVKRIVEMHPNLNRPTIRNPVSYTNVPPFIRSTPEQREPREVPMPNQGASERPASSQQDEQMSPGSLGPNESLATSLREIEESLLCRKCKRQRAEAIVLPCGHLCACHTCVTGMTKCFICGSRAQDTMTVYRA